MTEAEKQNLGDILELCGTEGVVKALIAMLQTHRIDDEPMVRAYHESQADALKLALEIMPKGGATVWRI